MAGWEGDLGESGNLAKVLEKGCQILAGTFGGCTFVSPKRAQGTGSKGVYLGGGSNFRGSQPPCGAQKQETAKYGAHQGGWPQHSAGKPPEKKGGAPPR